MCEDFVRERITQLRIKKGISEYQMSYDLGHSRGYVYNISSGTLPLDKGHYISVLTKLQRPGSFGEPGRK